MKVVKLEENTWLAPWGGDPGRTNIESAAKVFPSVKSAERALEKARMFGPFKDAEIQEVK